jgi:glycosyltransferase involved in cell wall biosynthesis
MVYLEGMRFGLPALASTAGAAHEIVTHGKTGFLVNPSDPELIARTIHLLHQDRHKLIDMGLAALERHRSHPTWTESAAAIRNFLHSMVTGS